MKFIYKILKSLAVSYTHLVGTKVKLLDVEFEEEEEYTIVGSSEADPSQNRLSYESPVGKALLGKKVGEIVEVEVPAGTIQFKILDITR